MNLWLSRHLLVAAALFLSSSALTPEECQPLITPLSLADPSVLYGKTYVLAGFTDHDAYKAMLKITDSSSVTFTESPSNTTEVIMSQANKINGTCIRSGSNVTIEGNTASLTLPNLVWSFHVLPSCSGCLIINVTCTLKNVKKLLQLMQLDGIAEDVDIHAYSLYLLANEATLKDSDLEHFKKQASCLGFSGEPDFIHDPEKSFCKEGEGFMMPYSH